ncbi:fimbrial protein [Salmonella enterica subsp. indica]|uniref:Fimbrial protein n=1 Tax=Salmonella enterica TaxID=28901 RepID=A0A701YSS9_SALER|nr:fimbrial protein [Salmonella enterica]EBP3213534.1 fimbrial protein [Salmonella enterica subsp. arizonae]ECI8271651.1 fimbrial protein [Salmonella enterica subsp. enterica]EDR2772696.1 fimbrial protein [Salmonella enterica subsp. enterica serovar Oslo]EEC4247683.1 fimbrial protein [Salmonella enterica subsp. diarizonae]HCM1933426.1 fimbrial protein [Salmonella enterica subsp. indica serovar 6,7:z41:1,7]
MKASFYIPVSLVTLFLLTGGLHAQDLSVNFDATVEESTCAMTITALGNATASGSVADGYTLNIPQMAVLDIINQTANTEGSFKLMPAQCNNEITSIVMTISGNVNPGNIYFIDNDTSISGYAENVSMAIKPKGGADAQYIKLNGAQSVTWTSAQITNGMDLSVLFRHLTTAPPVAGVFQANATFSFTYQ